MRLKYFTALDEVRNFIRTLPFDSNKSSVIELSWDKFDEIVKDPRVLEEYEYKQQEVPLENKLAETGKKAEGYILTINFLGEDWVLYSEKGLVV